MIKRFLIIFFIFLFGCSGYEPIFSKKTNLKINSINLEGEKRLNQIIYKNIKNLGNSDSQKNKLLNLKIDTQKKRKIHSKDTKGNPNKYKMNIETNVVIDLENSLVLSKNFFSPIYLYITSILILFIGFILDRKVASNFN